MSGGAAGVRQVGGRADAGTRRARRGSGRDHGRIEQPTEAEEMGQTYTEWLESTQPQVLERGIKQGIERGIAQGRTESRAMLVRLASRRFGVETAEKLAGLVRAMGAEQLARVGDAVVDCDTGDELLAAASNGAIVTADDMGHETGHETAC